MYKLGYLDDDKGNRTSFARQFEKTLTCMWLKI